MLTDLTALSAEGADKKKDDKEKKGDEAVGADDDERPAGAELHNDGVSVADMRIILEGFVGINLGG